MSTIWQDLRYGARMLWKSPVFTAVAVVALALGIGANTAIFSVVNALLLRPLPLAESERLVVLWSQSKKTGELSSSSYPDFADFREQNRVFEGVATLRPRGVTLTGAGEPERLEGARVSADFFPLLRVRPLHGRAFLPEEDRPGGERVVLLGHGLWQRRFGGDPGIVGRSVMLDEQPHTVVGVLPPDFRFPYTLEDAEVYSTIAYEGGNLQERGARTSYMLARLREGVTIDEARADAARIAAGLEEQYPDRNTGLGATAVGLQEQLVGKVERALWVLLGAVGLVLLIACSNVANLLLVRATTRHREIAIRTALGASRWRVVRQLLTESLMIAALAGVCGLLLAVWGVDLLVALSPDDLPRLDAVGLDGRVLAFTFGVSALTGVLFGLVPALKASKTELTESLKEGGRSTNMRPGRQRLRGLLVAGEVALALMLLVGAGLLLKSFRRLQAVDPGFDPKGVLTMRINLPRARYTDGESRARFVGAVVEGVRELPGVRAAAFVTPVPFSFSNVSSDFEVEGRPAPPVGQEPSASYRGVTPDYFRAMNIPVLRGRQFTDQDRRGGPTGVAIINEAVARRYFEGEDPLGKVLKSVGVNVDEDEPERWEIVGVVGNVRHAGLDVEPYAEIYFPHRQQSWNWGHFVVRADGDLAALAPAVRAQVHAIDRDQAVSEVRPLAEMIAGTVAKPRFYALLLASFAVVGLLLALVGIYGVLSYTVTERTHEIGVRMALGAQRRDILKLVVTGGMTYALVGVVAGLVGARAVTHVLSKLLFEVSATDAPTFAGIALLLGAVALAACYLPARRATKVDPMVALRYE